MKILRLISYVSVFAISTATFLGCESKSAVTKPEKFRAAPTEEPPLTTLGGPGEEATIQQVPKQ